MVMALLGQPYLIPRRADLKPIGPVLKCSLGPFHRFENHLLTTGIRNHIPVIRTRSVGNNPDTGGMQFIDKLNTGNLGYGIVSDH
jgi:hypothetical protein